MVWAYDGFVHMIQKMVVSILPSSSLIKLTWACAESRCITDTYNGKQSTIVNAELDRVEQFFG